MFLTVFSPMLGRWTRNVARFAAGAGLLAAVALGASKTADAEASLLDVPLFSAAPVAYDYAWAPSQSDAHISPSEGALSRRFAGLALHLAPEDGAEAPPALAGDLTDSLDSILQRASRRADVSVHARDLRTGAVLYDHDGDTALNPASNQKVLTAAVALDLLGPDYTFETRVLRSGRSLILQGEGDPSLDRDDLQAMAVIVADQLDLGDVDRIIVDDSAFGPERFAPGFSDEGYGAAYEAPSGALSVDFNTVEIRVAPAVGESMPTVEVDAAGAHIEVRNEASVGRRGSISVRTFAEGDSTVVLVRGNMSRSARPVVVRRRILDPGLHAGTVFAERLAEQWESEALPVERGGTPAESEWVVVNASPPLSEILERGLAYSNNFIAEQVLRTMAWHVYAEPGGWDTGADIVRTYWEALGRRDDAVIENGSGLTRRGRLTAAGLVDVLVAASMETPSLIEALPASGDPGTMRARLRRAEGRVRAKTGTLNGVSGLSGILTDASGQPTVAFSVIVNAHVAAFMPAASRRQVEDKVVLALLAAAD